MREKPAMKIVRLWRAAIQTDDGVFLTEWNNRKCAAKVWAEDCAGKIVVFESRNVRIHGKNINKIKSRW